MELVRSPLNYTGNKYRLLNQLLPLFPKEMDVFVDLFCGGATVGMNVKAKKTVFVDNNERVIELLQYLATCRFSELLKSLEKVICSYNLSYSAQNTYEYYAKAINSSNRNNGLKEYNSVGYYEMRANYNSMSDKSSATAQQYLYLLMVYAFNNDIRFNKLGNFNLPVGKTDLNSSNLNKLKEYINRANEKESVFLCGDFRDVGIQDTVLSASFVYADPPYLITDAVYNESNGWNIDKEKSLLLLYTQMLEEKTSFLFSNILSKEGVVNEPLSSWIDINNDKIDVRDIDYHYRSASYNKKNREAGEREIAVKKAV